MRSHKTIIAIIFIFLFSIAGLISCKKDSKNTNTNATPQQACETDNTGTLAFYNNTTNLWEYNYKADNDIITYATDISANSSLSVDVTAGKFYNINWCYNFKYNDTEYTWIKQTTRQDVTTCTKSSISLNDDCDTHELGYLVYANHTNNDITIIIDGNSYSPLAPNEVRGFPVASGVAHNVRGTSSMGNYQFTPSVGRCERLATVLL